MSQPIRISYKHLQTDPVSQESFIRSAFGSSPGALGVILIDDLPSEFAELREKLFHLSYRFANLPESSKDAVARPETSYFFGWSHGKEVMNGRPDLQKGSYYANPLLDRPDVSEKLRAEHPEYYAGNVWPSGVDGLEEYESTFKALGQVIFDVGLALARACGPFVAPALSNNTAKITVESLIAKSQCHKARLLHYFPQSPDMSTEVAERIADDALCGTHVDHSLLTGLCSAMYLRPSPSGPPSIVPPPSPTSGLYIYPRHPPNTPRPEAVKVSIPPECLAFQTGETLELLTGGRLAATPHFVSGNAASDDPASAGVSRETFAFFLQPDVDDVVSPDGETFGAFTKRVLGRHYADQLAKEAED